MQLSSSWMECARSIRLCKELKPLQVQVVHIGIWIRVLDAMRLIQESGCSKHSQRNNLNVDCKLA